VSAETPRPTAGGAAFPPDVRVTEEWDAGDLGCGELVLELRTRLDRMRQGDVLRLVARDPGAPADLPAWCRLTGHTLLSADHPLYHVRRKET
jgi:tRNA 2-thiouridine synthesizing protein A